MHVHGVGTGVGAVASDIRPCISERWKKRFEERSKRSFQDMQIVCVESRDDKADERRANPFIQCAEVRDDFKCQRVGEDTRAGELSRRSLRESLIERTIELKQKRSRSLDDHADRADSVKQKLNVIPLHGNDAITRLINLGRQHQGAPLGRRSTVLEGREPPPRRI